MTLYTYNYTQGLYFFPEGGTMWKMCLLRLQRKSTRIFRMESENYYTIEDLCVLHVVEFGI